MTALKSKSWRSRRAGVKECFFWNEVYECGVLLLFPVNQTTMNTSLRELGMLDRQDSDVKFTTYARHLWNGEKRLHAIVFSERAVKSRDIGCIAHEALHCANAILEERGIRSPTENDEPLAYMVGWLVRNICEQMRIR